MNTTFLFLYIFLTCAALSGADVARQPGMQLVVGMESSGSENLIFFLLINNQDSPITIDELGHSDNKVTFTNPIGNERILARIVNKADRATIAPGERKKWTMSALQYLQLYFHGSEPGIYTISWSIGAEKSNLLYINSDKIMERIPLGSPGQ